MEQIVPFREFIYPQEFDLFAGLDVDKRHIVVTYLDHRYFERSLKLPYDAQNLISYTRKQFPGERVAFVYEAGPTGFGLHDALLAAGEVCLVASPAMVPVAAGNRVKTNRLDSRRLAQVLRGGEVRGIRVPVGAYRELRQLAQLRDTHVQAVRATKCRIKGLLLQEGLAFPEAPAGSQWSRRVIGELKELACSVAVRYKIDSHLQTLSFHQGQAVQAQKEMRRLCASDEDLAESVGYLRSIDGVGWIVASQVLARVGDWRRLKKVREMGAFVGLVPCEDSTGDRTRRGAITRTGDRRLRAMLIQAAWAAIRKDTELGAFYERVYQHRPKDRAAGIAIVAVARKLTTRMYCVLTERREYRLKRKAD